MNREIKFRAWDKESGIMDYFPTYDSIPLDINAIFRGSTFVWMQYTGLKDKNGKDIYEGDIVTVLGLRRKPTKVIYGNGAFFTSGNHEKFEPINSFRNYEIIGNVFEHPHLLE